MGRERENGVEVLVYSSQRPPCSLAFLHAPILVPRLDFPQMTSRFHGYGTEELAILYCAQRTPLARATNAGMHGDQGSQRRTAPLIGCHDWPIGGQSGRNF